MSFITPHLSDWKNRHLAMGPVTCPTRSFTKFDAVFFVDSCGSAAGLIAAYAKDDFIPMPPIFVPWTDVIQHSKTSEPRGISEIAFVFSHIPFDCGLIVSDHTPAVAAINRGHGKSRENNNMMMCLKSAFPSSTLRSLHIPGWMMPADPISRGVHLIENGLRDRVMKKYIDMVRTGETGFTFCEPRPCSTNIAFARLDNCELGSKDDQIESCSLLLNVPSSEISNFISIDSTTKETNL